MCSLCSAGGKIGDLLSGGLLGLGLRMSSSSGWGIPEGLDEDLASVNMEDLDRELREHKRVKEEL